MKKLHSKSDLFQCKKYCLCFYNLLINRSRRVRRAWRMVFVYSKSPSLSAQWLLFLSYLELVFEINLDFHTFSSYYSSPPIGSDSSLNYLRPLDYIQLLFEINFKLGVRFPVHLF